jgi:hypothetical protein
MSAPLERFGTLGYRRSIPLLKTSKSGFGSLDSNFGVARPCPRQA